MNAKTIRLYNEKFRTASPSAIAAWALNLMGTPVITTNFRPYEAALLHCVVTHSPGIPVVWCDTGYNTSHTYRHAEDLRRLLSLNLKVYVPHHTVAHREVTIGQPGIDHPDHARFTEEVKLEPFRRAMAEIQPTLWFTNIRKGQTAVRDSLDILSLTSDGILKVSPFYHWEDSSLDTYLEDHQLPNEHRYTDPTKVLANRECGLHK